MTSYIHPKKRILFKTRKDEMDEYFSSSCSGHSSQENHKVLSPKFPSLTSPSSCESSYRQYMMSSQQLKAFKEQQHQIIMDIRQQFLIEHSIQGSRVTDIEGRRGSESESMDIDITDYTPNSPEVGKASRTKSPADSNHGNSKSPTNKEEAKKRNPKCARCRNHGLQNVVRGERLSWDVHHALLWL